MSKAIIDCSERSIQNVVTKLNFIGKIESGKKVDVKTLQLCNNTYYTSLYRTLFARGESRTFTLEFIKNTLEEAYGLIRFFTGKESGRIKSSRAMLLDAIKYSRQGIQNLRITYSEDYYFTSEIDTLLTTLSTKIELFDTSCNNLSNIE